VRDLAQAGAILARENDDDSYDDSFVAGLGDSYAGGLTSSLGKSLAAAHGTLAGSGSSRSGSSADAGTLDRSRQAWLVTNVVWDCGFPPEADSSELHYAAVEVAVTVQPDGSAESVDVLVDPGHGFAAVATTCALEQRFIPALDREGRPIRAVTRPFTIGFHR
jgi:protein TonB